ncbi:MAG TPA: aminotransferase class V-fold PLP-dependent enzyme [Mesotoga infera]|uniref:Aminotransferase class V-fold PLP-dependent enzyme n=1 Tax=Mesotoga infera TaxID=1236046 RepID=A0A7C1GSP8_9BACT|nr:aminotransferase class V-fold PLP-dependent enzyme [Mesotoga infera]
MSLKETCDFSIKEVRKDFPVFRHHPSLAYLDNAATSQKPQSVIDAVNRFYERENANVHRAVYPLAEKSTALYESSRCEVARFIGAARDELVFTKGSTESLNIVANALATSGLYKTFVVPTFEHHSNFLPWQYHSLKNGIKFVALPIMGAELTMREVAESLTGIESPFVFSLGGLINATGYRTPFEALNELVHSLGGLTVIDGAQLVPHESFDFKKVNADFLIFSGHKMLAETGIGCLVGRSELLDDLTPLAFGGGMVDRVSVETSSYAKEGVSRLEGGTQNISGAVSLAAACRYLNKIGMSAIHDYVSHLTETAREMLKKISDVTVYSPTGSHAILLFSHKKIHSHDLAEFLGRTQGVAIRSGHHCAQLQMEAFGINSACRASFYFYNTVEDVERLIEGIRKAESWFL